MREILFRGKRTDNHQWVYGYYIMQGEENPNPYIVNHGGMIRVAHKSIGQYTGLKDKNGKRIFEGDLIKHDGKMEVPPSIGYVYFGRSRSYYADKNVGFFVKWVVDALPEFLREDLGFWCDDREIEVIGNIHDNPELLEVHHE